MNTPENVAELLPNQIFVFGSNLQGYHGGGAALVAKSKFGAVQGEGIGRTGQCYAVPTCELIQIDYDGHTLCKLSLSTIRNYLQDFCLYTYRHPLLEFLVTKIGTGIAGYSIEEMKTLFKQFEWSDNVILPIEFI